MYVCSSGWWLSRVTHCSPELPAVVQGKPTFKKRKRSNLAWHSSIDNNNTKHDATPESSLCAKNNQRSKVNDEFVSPSPRLSQWSLHVLVVPSALGPSVWNLLFRVKPAPLVGRTNLDPRRSLFSFFESPLSRNSASTKNDDKTTKHGRQQR